MQSSCALLPFLTILPSRVEKYLIILFTEAERLACLTRMEVQRATEYRTRLHKFKQEFPTADELFTWTLNSVHLKVLADSTFSDPEQVIERMKQIDSCRWVYPVRLSTTTHGLLVLSEMEDSPFRSCFPTVSLNSLLADDSCVHFNLGY